ncbi:MAG TPA: DUF5715 family protein [Pyrinomonadaceae bacterium]|nr:DUF5715 family protein [Pyrinomonadaceae bacterium]
MSRWIFVSMVLFATLVMSALAVFRYKGASHQHHQPTTSNSTISDADAWYLAVEKVKADREGEGSGAIEIPSELKHYSERHWFLATQVAEIAKYHVHTSQDYIDLAATINRGEMVAVPWVTETYILFGVGAKADDSAFTRYEDDHAVELYNEAQLNEAYRQLEVKRSNLKDEISSLKTQAGKLSKRSRAKQNEIQKQLNERETELQKIEEEKSLLDQSYQQPGSRQRLMSEYESFQTLAKTFRGHSYNLDLPADRTELKISLLSSLRPQALKILEEVASLYHKQFDRPLPISSLVRPEQYQHVLHRVNRNAVVIDTPPHSTGLAFDIDYRYMSSAEQTYLMAELARIKREGRIEVIRERNANFHVFAFVNGTRPSDELIAESLIDAGADPSEVNPPTEDAKGRNNTKSSKVKTVSMKVRKRR